MAEWLRRLAATLHISVRFRLPAPKFEVEMITVRKMKDDGWNYRWYFAEATKMNKKATGVTKGMAVMNLKKVMRDALRK